MLDKQFHPRKIILKCCEVKQRAVIFIHQYRQVQLTFLLQVRPNLFQRLYGRDLVDRFIHCIISILYPIYLLIHLY